MDESSLEGNMWGMSQWGLLVLGEELRTCRKEE